MIKYIKNINNLMLSLTFIADLKKEDISQTILEINPNACIHTCTLLCTGTACVQNVQYAYLKD